MKKALGFITLGMGILCLASCGTNHYVFDCDGSIHAVGSDTVTIKTTEAKFEKSAVASDFTLSDKFDGKSVSSIEYIDENTVKLVIEGTLSDIDDSSSDYEYDLISVKDHAIKGSATAEAAVALYRNHPYLVSMSNTYYCLGGIYWEYETEYSLSYGKFNLSMCTTENIHLLSSGTLTIDFEAGNSETITLNVSSFSKDDTYSAPVVKFDAVCTEFNQEITDVTLGTSFAKFPLYK